MFADQKFELGQIVDTPPCLAALEAAGTNALVFVQRHVSGDWGELCAEDVAENKLSIKEGFRILSAYTLKTGVKIWVVTERDRSSTCVLLPEDY